MGILHKRISNPTGANILREKRKDWYHSYRVDTCGAGKKKKTSSARSDISLSRLLKLTE